jgi:ribosomal protein S18 acetylase RimI-like enzyme
VTVRRAAEADFDTLAGLWRAFNAEVPEPAYVDLDPEQELAEIREIVRDEIALLAEEDGRALGFALARRRSPRRATLTDLYVVPGARRRGLAAGLVREAVDLLRADGFEYLDLEVQAANAPARAVYQRWGLREHLHVLVGHLDELSVRLAPRVEGASFGSIHVQSDDLAAVERAVRQFVPRLPGRSRGSIVSPPRQGWIAIHDDVCDRDPRQLRRLARELSDRMGSVVLALGVEDGAVVRFVLHERGSIVDEYLSVQEYYGPLPPGDVVALAANPRVVARLTGADPEAVRAAALHARSPAELPPPAEVLAGLATAMGVHGADHGWADAPETPGAIRIDRA